MAGDEFYASPDPASKVKIQIVCKYFKAWSDVVMGFQDSRSRGKKTISYIDLYAGKGRYDDGTPSTPVRILQMAIKDLKLRKRLYAYLNDANPAFTKELRKNIEELEGFETLQHPPTIVSQTVDESAAEAAQDVEFPPSLVFLDPWGYSGLSVDLFEAFLSNWGTDLIFFFNYNRINPGLSNEVVAKHMNRLFGGRKRADELRDALDEAISPTERQQLIVDAMRDALKMAGGEWVLNFEFRAPGADRPSHYLFFATEHPKGFDIMKSVMAKLSSGTQDRGPLFDRQREIQTSLLEEIDPLGKLKRQLIERFAGQRHTRDDLHRIHQRETGASHMFLKKHYNAVLRDLEEEGKITLHARKEGRRKGDFPKYVDIEFPESTEQPND